MKSILHWIAAAWVMIVGSVFAVGLAVVLCYVIYLAFTEWGSVATTIGALLAFLWSCHWAGTYIDNHGWPWKPKASPVSESAKP